VINSGYLIMITGTIYTLVSIDQFMRANIPMSLTYFAYALSNVGLWMAVTK
jgi:hypothetical protein